MDGWMDGWMDEGREGREAQPAHQRQQQLWLRFVGVDSPSLWASKGQSQTGTRQRGAVMTGQGCWFRLRGAEI